MPKITELYEVDGKVCCFLDMPTMLRSDEHGIVHVYSEPELASVIAAAVAAEREACAKTAETVKGDFERDTPGRTEGATRQGVAAAIRARSNNSN